MARRAHILVKKRIAEVGRTLLPLFGWTTAHGRKKEEKVMKSQQLCRILGTAVFGFGVGILVSFFLPETVLVVIEALTIIGIGLIYFSKK